jgi:hypothetical protein
MSKNQEELNYISAHDRERFASLPFRTGTPVAFALMAGLLFGLSAHAQTTDLVAFGGAGWASIPMASPNRDGSVTVTNFNVNDFPVWAATPGVKILTGDFNGDGKTDLVAFGGAGWASIPVAFSNGGGSFTVTNFNVNDFPVWAATPGVKVVAGDFNGDGKTDLAAFGVAGWASIPIAFSNGNGSFTVTNFAVNDFPVWAATPGVKVLAGDFNGDGRTDLVAFGGGGWASIPIAFSNGNGSFNVTNSPVNDFPAWVATPGVQVLVGDFNDDARTDLVAFGGAGWASIPIAFSNGDGSFTVTNSNVNDFPAWATTPGVKVLIGDFNGDTRADLIAFGGVGWASIPIAFSNGNGSFTVTNFAANNFPAWAATPGVKILAGDFNGDAKTDLIAFGGAGWASIPIAFSNGNGSFTVTNDGVPNFPAWVATPGVQVLAGAFNGDGRPF